ncbi:MAG: gamma-glutamyl-gamma-aminobutyrate hydrolase family protein [Oscillospiraceae bacterium]|nr:gamma-glutamyl-gamma-aminobutyrate hydrolase family protein [Oscillospiraceae bacterium]
MKPVIGVMPLWDDEKESIWMLPGYLEGIRQAGGLPIILPLTDNADEIGQLADMCSGFLFTGGHDVDPKIYNETSIGDIVSPCRQRDEMEKIFLEFAIKQDKSVLGICRGIQFINAVLGGSLYQDIPLQHKSDTEHHQKPPYDVPVHSVILRENKPLHRLLNITELKVNSYHHQAIKTLAPGLMEMAVSEDGLTEAVCMPRHHFLWAVQWHPEFSYLTDASSRAIFSAFVDSML